jgi:hypothetical protein
MMLVSLGFVRAGGHTRPLNDKPYREVAVELMFGNRNRFGDSTGWIRKERFADADQASVDAINALARSNKTHPDRLNICTVWRGVPPNPRSPMSYKSPRINAGEPSFFYLMLAEICFRRAAGTGHPKASSTLREIGRNYLANANTVTSMLESQPSQLRRATVQFPAE